MTEETRKPAQEQVQLGDPGEHPLSVLLFSWMRSTLFFRIVMALLAGAGVVLIGLDVLLIRHSYSSFESLPGFFGIFGFVAFSLAVLSGWPLGRLMRRPEDYYEPQDRDGQDGTGEGGNDR
jgi:hypothetical protein